MLHDVVSRDPIQGQGHKTFGVRNSSIFLKSICFAICSGIWQVTSYS